MNGRLRALSLSRPSCTLPVTLRRAPARQTTADYSSFDSLVCEILWTVSCLCTLLPGFTLWPPAVARTWAATCPRTSIWPANSMESRPAMNLNVACTLVLSVCTCVQAGSCQCTRLCHEQPCGLLCLLMTWVTRTCICPNVAWPIICPVLIRTVTPKSPNLPLLFPVSESLRQGVAMPILLLVKT